MSVSTTPVISLIRGDGIGPEISEAVVKMLDAAGAKLSYEELPAGEGALRLHQDPLPEITIQSISKNKVAL
ncbi:MAG TPA: isocitrate/isopropylmalate family dehydrogenase, partial [Pseudomonadota bacterium]|nr:isocitrate/isopropylmalate family dehydrogenase [Pseudomonadota bacterium]